MNDGASNASGDSKTSEVRVRRKKVTVERVLSTGSFGFVWLCSFAPGVNVVVKFAPAADILARQHRSESGNRDTSPLATRSSAELHREALSLSLETAEIIVSAVESSPFLVNVVLDTSLERVRYNEAITNGTLYELAKNGPLGVDALRLFGAEIFLGMAALHTVGVMHRDLKLENVGINADGHVRLCGFDYCYKFDAQSGTAILPYGTLSSQAPECFMSEPARFEPDYWAFGVLLMELLGEMVFRASNAQEIADLVCADTIRVPYSQLGTPLGDLLSGVFAKKEERMNQERVQAHPFFLEHFSWAQILAQQNSPLEMYMAEAEGDAVDEVVNEEVSEERSSRVFSNTSTREIVEATEHHPFIINHFFDVPEIHGHLSFMEHLGNGDLFELASRGPISLPALRLFAAEIFLGMSALHDAGFVHRDLKLENIGISSSGHVRLFDFDLCYRFAHAEETVTTEAGTLTSSAPEVLMRKPARFEPDYWSFGVLLMELQDEYRFESETQEEIVRMICTEPYRIPGHVRRTVFGDLVSGLLNLDKDQRFRQAHVRSHAFFAGLDWTDVLRLKSNPLEAWIANAEYSTGYSIQDEGVVREEITRLKAEFDVEDATSFEFH